MKSAEEVSELLLRDLDLPLGSVMVLFKRMGDEVNLVVRMRPEVKLSKDVLVKSYCGYVVEWEYQDLYLSYPVT